MEEGSHSNQGGSSEHPLNIEEQPQQPSEARKTATKTWKQPQRKRKKRTGTQKVRQPSTVVEQPSVPEENGEVVDHELEEHKRKRTSWVWNHFELGWKDGKKGGDLVATCKYYNRQ